MPCASTEVPTGLDPRAPEPLRLRPATLADAPALALAGAATFLEAFTWMLPGPDIVSFCAAQHTPALYAHYLALPSTRITLATTGIDTVVGYAMVTTPDLPSFDVLPGDAELKRIYLFSRFRGANTPVLDTEDNTIPNLRGGQALMDAAIAGARELDAKRLLLGTHAGNEQAIAFYHRNGFTGAGVRTFQVGAQQCCDLILAKVL